MLLNCYVYVVTHWLVSLLCLNSGYSIGNMFNRGITGAVGNTPRSWVPSVIFMDWTLTLLYFFLHLRCSFVCMFMCAYVFKKKMWPPLSTPLPLFPNTHTPPAHISPFLFFSGRISVGCIAVQMLKRVSLVRTLFYVEVFAWCIFIYLFILCSA